MQARKEKGPALHAETTVTSSGQPRREARAEGSQPQWAESVTGLTAADRTCSVNPDPVSLATGTTAGAQSAHGGWPLPRAGGLHAGEDVRVA